MSDESDNSTASTTDNSHILEDMAQKLKAADTCNRSSWPHKCDMDFYDRCEELGLCVDCGCIDLAQATDEEKRPTSSTCFAGAMKSTSTSQSLPRNKSK